MKKIIIFVLIIILSNIGVSYAQVKKGTKEIGAAGTLSFIENFNFYTFVTTFGYFVTPKIQLGLTGIGVESSSEEDIDMKTYSLGLHMKYHFYKEGQIVVPYLGGQAGIKTYPKINVEIEMYNDEVTETKTSTETGTSFFWGGIGGLKFFLTENISFNLEANYQNVTDEDSDVTDVLQLLFGFSTYF